MPWWRRRLRHDRVGDLASSESGLPEFQKGFPRCKRCVQPRIFPFRAHDSVRKLCRVRLLKRRHLLSEPALVFVAPEMDAWIGVVGVIAGVVLGLFGERWRHSYIRNDASTDRQAATLREALDAYTAFVLAWAPLSFEVAQGKPVDMRDPSVVGGPPGLTHQRLAAVNERIHIESIRLRMGELVARVVMAVANGKVTAATVEANAAFGTQVAADIGTELRKLEAQ